MGRIEAVERLADVLGVDHLAEHLGRLRGDEIVENVVADAGIMDAPGLGMAGIGQHRSRQLEFGLRQRRRIVVGETTEPV